MKKKTRNRKTSQGNSSSEEKECLLKQETEHEEKKNRAVLKRRESKISTVAPLAKETEFEDVPVLTICQFCDQKVVTKTHFDKKKTICFCCCICHPTLTYIFKDVIHSCPKCNNEIAKYNRFLFCFRRNKIPKADKNQNTKFVKESEFTQEFLTESLKYPAARQQSNSLNEFTAEGKEAVKSSEGGRDIEDGERKEEKKNMIQSENDVKEKLKDKNGVLLKMEPLMGIGNGLIETCEKKKRKKFSFKKAKCHTLEK